MRYSAQIKTMNSGFIVGFIQQGNKHAKAGQFNIAINHVGFWQNPMRITPEKMLFDTGDNGSFVLKFCWDSYDTNIGEASNKILPHRLNIFGGQPFKCIGKIVGDYSAANSECIYSEMAKVATCLDLKTIKNGASPPPPFDTIGDIIST